MASPKKKLATARVFPCPRERKYSMGLKKETPRRRGISQNIT